MRPDCDGMAGRTATGRDRAKVTVIKKGTDAASDDCICSFILVSIEDTSYSFMSFPSPFCFSMNV